MLVLIRFRTYFFNDLIFIPFTGEAGRNGIDGRDGKDGLPGMPANDRTKIFLVGEPGYEGSK